MNMRLARNLIYTKRPRRNAAANTAMKARNEWKSRLPES